jgi:hypothetical protein
MTHAKTSRKGQKSLKKGRKVESVKPLMVVGTQCK